MMAGEKIAPPLHNVVNEYAAVPAMPLSSYDVDRQAPAAAESPPPSWFGGRCCAIPILLGHLLF